jgi:hypothetical protein
VPTGNQGAWVSIVLVDKRGNELRTYDNVVIADVDNARNFKRIEAQLSSASNDDINDAASFRPIMRGAAGC